MPSFNHERDSQVNTFVSGESKTIVFMDSIASRLKSSREKKGWTQEKLAKEAGVSQGTVGNIESGARRSHGSLPRLAEALGVSNNWLRDGVGQDSLAAPTAQQSKTNVADTVYALLGFLSGLSIDERKAAGLFMGQMAESQSTRWAELLVTLLESKLTPVNSDRMGKPERKVIPEASSSRHNDQTEPVFGPALTKLFGSAKGKENGLSTEFSSKPKAAAPKKRGGKHS